MIIYGPIDTTPEGSSGQLMKRISIAKARAILAAASDSKIWPGRYYASHKGDLLQARTATAALATSDEQHAPFAFISGKHHGTPGLFEMLMSEDEAWLGEATKGTA